MINSSEMSVDFHAAALERGQISPIKIDPSISKIYSFKQYIYSWMALDELIKELKKQPRDTFDPENDRLERLSIRFVVDKMGNPWFALEGEESGSTPVHSQMVNEDVVLTAGNLVFSEDYETIIEITNKSGHYLPEFKTMVFFTQILFALEADPRFYLRIAPEIKVVRYARQSSFIPDPISHITLPKEALRNALPVDLTPLIQHYPFAKIRTAAGVQSVFDSFKDYFDHKNLKSNAGHSLSNDNVMFRPSTSIKTKNRRSLQPFNDSAQMISSYHRLTDFGLFRTTSMTSEKRSNDALNQNKRDMTNLLPSSMLQGHPTSPQITASHNAILAGSPGDAKKIRLFSEHEHLENTSSTTATLVL